MLGYVSVCSFYIMAHFGESLCGGFTAKTEIKEAWRNPASSVSRII